jgi:hypothetical protein
MIHRRHVLLAALLGLGILGACSIRQEIALNPDGSGEAWVRVVLQGFFADYLKDLAEFAGTARGPGTAIFDEIEIRSAFEKRRGVTIKELRIAKPEELQLRLAFTSIDDLVRGEADLSSSGIVTFRNVDGTRTLRLHLDRANYGKLSSLLPSSDGSTDTILSVFGPQEGLAITEAEYLETMEFTLGAEGPKALRESFIEVAVTVNGRLVSQKGGTVRNNTVTFRIPILKVLLLNEPLDYEIVFR